MSLVHELDALLPQTQCGECGYPGCLPYAQALAAKQAPINRCPPGGVATLKKLGLHLNIDVKPYLEDDAFKTRPPTVALIREPECIGCTKCIQACPVDAIIGTGTMMHTIIEQECTGCGLCVEPCPVDCIEMTPKDALTFDKDKARARFNTKQVRTLRETEEQARSYRDKRQLSKNQDAQKEDKQAKQSYILAALERVKAKGKT